MNSFLAFTVGWSLGFAAHTASTPLLVLYLLTAGVAITWWIKVNK